MKKIILVVLLGILKLGTVDAQCCPYLGNFEIIPENPTATDSVYLVTNVTTPNLGAYLGYSIEENSMNEIKIRACYWEGVFTVLTDFRDTINLGVKDLGAYTLEFTAVSSLNEFSCVPIDSNLNELISFEVGTMTSTFEREAQAEIQCFPNPINQQELEINAATLINELIILDAYGRIVLRKNGIDVAFYTINTEEWSAGTYFVQVIDKEKNSFIKKVVKL